METEDLSEAIEKYRDQQEMYSNEGRRGVENLCKLARVIGYKDNQYFGQLSNGSSIGDLIEFLEDNSGAIDAVIEWMGTINAPEWKEAIKEELVEEEVEEEVE